MPTTTTHSTLTTTDPDPAHPAPRADAALQGAALQDGALRREAFKEETLREGALVEGALKDLETVGDVVMAGRRSPYPHLSEHLDRTRPTIGALAAIVRRLAADPSAWRPRLDAPDPDPAMRPNPAARRESAVRVVLARTGDHEVGVVRLGVDRFTGLDRFEGVLCLVEGGLHLVTTHAGGMLAMHRLRPGRVRVIGSGFGHELLNTGPSPAVALYATTLRP